MTKRSPEVSFAYFRPNLCRLPLLIVALVLTSIAPAQQPHQPPAPQPETEADASSLEPTGPAPFQRTPLPRPTPVYSASPNNSYFVNVGAFCGMGATSSPLATKPTAGCGFGGAFLPLPLFVEFGIMAPQANRSYLSGYLSVDGRIPLASLNVHYLPMAIAGYSRLFETGHALDYGLALATPRFGSKDHSASFQFELRDYWTFANPAQHNIMLRIGWMNVASD
jgi:hypothetical protein